MRQDDWDPVRQESQCLRLLFLFLVSLYTADLVEGIGRDMYCMYHCTVVDAQRCCAYPSEPRGSPAIHASFFLGVLIISSTSPCLPRCHTALLGMLGIENLLCPGLSKHYVPRDDCPRFLPLARFSRVPSLAYLQTTWTSICKLSDALDTVNAQDAGQTSASALISVGMTRPLSPTADHKRPAFSTGI